MQKNHKVFSQLSAALKCIKLGYAELVPILFYDCCYTPSPLQDTFLYSSVFDLAQFLFHSFLKFMSVCITVDVAPHIQVLAKCPILNNLKGSSLVSVLSIRQHWWNQQQRFEVNPSCLGSMWSCTVIGWINMTSSTSACINHNNFVRSLMTSTKFASKQDKALYYTTDKTNLFCT